MKEAPITIEFDVEGSPTESIRFHAVMKEDHTASSQITSFPVQTGFDISNHAIRKNREIVLDGIFTDSILANTNQIKYSESDTPKEMFKVLGTLVNSRTVCTVKTRLGTYYPVIFTSFKPVTDPKYINSMKFTMVGSEVQLADEVARTTATELSFVQLNTGREDAVLLEHEQSNLPLTWELLELGRAKEEDRFGRILVADTVYTLGTDFKIVTLDSSGLPRTTKYICISYDYKTKQYTYETVVDYAPVIEKSSVAIVPNSVLLSQYVSGMPVGIASCVIDNSISLAKDTVKSRVDSFIGKTEERLDGLLGGMTTLSASGSGILDPLLGITMDCVTSTVKTAQVDALEALKGNVLSPAEEYINESVESIRSQSLATIAGLEFPQTEAVMTKITNPIKGALNQLSRTFRDITS